MDSILLILYALISIFCLIVAQHVARFTTNSLVKRISSNADALEKSTPTDSIEKKNIENEAAIFRMVVMERERKKGNLGILTMTIGIIEFLAFYIITFSVLLFSRDLNILKNLGQFLGGWLAIKTIGNYNQWSSSVFGRACFYVFLLGTLINIGCAIIFAFVGYLLIPYIGV